MKNYAAEKRSRLWGPYLVGLGLCMAIVTAIAATINVDFSQVVVMVIFTVALLVAGVFVWFADRNNMEESSRNRF